MMAVETYTKSGTKSAAPTKLDNSVFGVELKNHNLLKDAYLAYLANSRENLAKAKKRGEVRGGGQKPWRQKGTGRARVGSSRNPVWTGGGVAFGPTGAENYSRKLSSKAKLQALRQALSLAAKENRIKIIEDFNPVDGKTKNAANLLSKINAQGNVLVVADTNGRQLDLPLRNLAGVKLIVPSYLTTYDLLNAGTVVITKKSLEDITNWL